MKAYLIAALATCAFAAPAAAQVMTPVEYVAAAGASDLYERTSSRIVLESTRDPKVRGFAQMMVAHHTKSTADVKAAAARSRVRAPAPKLTPAQAEMIAQLRAETGPARDAAYVAQQKAAHGQALDVHKGYATKGTAPALRQAASGIVPVVERHIAELQTM